MPIVPTPYKKMEYIIQKLKSVVESLGYVVPDIRQTDYADHFEIFDPNRIHVRGVIWKSEHYCQLTSLWWRNKCRGADIDSLAIALDNGSNPSVVKLAQDINKAFDDKLTIKMFEHAFNYDYYDPRTKKTWTYPCSF